MTRERIARVIDFVDHFMQSHFNDYGEETHRALQEAIKLIEQEPCEDAISREAAVNACLNKWDKDYKEIVADIRALPPVKPQEPILDKIRAEIEQAADKQLQIAMGVTDLNERYTHIQMDNAYRHSLNIIDKYRKEE